MRPKGYPDPKNTKKRAIINQTNMNTLFDKIWDAHVVGHVEGGSDILYIDRQYIHEVTSPQAFEGLRRRGISVFRPRQVTARTTTSPPNIRNSPRATRSPAPR